MRLFVIYIISRHEPFVKPCKHKFDKTRQICYQAILQAEGTKRSQILVAEGEKESAILRADAEKQSAILRAQGQAEAILAVQKATAEAMQMLNDACPNDQVIKLKALEAMQKVADGKATKIIIPSELQGLAGLAAGLVETVREPKQ